MDILSYLLGKNSAGGGGGDDVSKYLDLAPTNAGSTQWNWWQTKFALSDMGNLVITPPAESLGAFQQMFKDCKWTYLPKVAGTFNDGLFIQNMYQNCSNAKIIDLSELEGPAYRLGSTFNGCSSLEKIDMRKMTIGAGATFSSMLNSVPTTCLIIVKDADTKTWFNTNFSSYTNVKTAAEYEAD